MLPENLFSDGESPTDNLVPDGNPYSPPAVSQAGWWDKTLLRRIVKTWMFIAAWFMLMDIFILVKFFTFSHGQTVHMGPTEMVKAFFVDWSF